MDEATSELLSRLLDGDLETADRARLEERLHKEPKLRAELEAMKRLQAATRAVAQRMDPPGSLDAMMKPLRTGAPHAPRRMRPAVRWIGMAAGLALAVTVAMEVARRAPDPMETPRSRREATADAPEETEIYQLKPLPTSSVPPEEELIGVSERLLASPPAEPELDEPEALYVQGPLPMEDNEPGFESRDEAKNQGGRMAVEESVARDQPKSSPARGQVAAAPSNLEARASGKKLDRIAETTRLVLRSEDGVRVGEVLLKESWLHQGPPVKVRVSDGVIVAVGIQDGDKDGFGASEESREALLGAATPGIPDGRYVVSKEAESRQ